MMTRQVILSEAGLAETKGRAPLLRVSLNRHRVSCLEPESAMKEAVAFLCVSPVLPPFACVVLYALGNLVFFFSLSPPSPKKSCCPLTPSMQH